MDTRVRTRTTLPVPRLAPDLAIVDDPMARPRAARHWIVRELAARGYDGKTEISIAVALVLSELGTNALIHAGDVLGVFAVFGAGQLRIGVVDADIDHLPQPNRPDPSKLDERTRGVGFIVRAYAKRWGVEENIEQGTKEVWAEFDWEGDSDAITSSAA